MNDQRPGILAISTYEKGQVFLREAAALGCDVTLLTVHKLGNATWPRDVLAGFYTMPEHLQPHEVLPYVTRLATHRRIDRVVALDEFDMDAAALAREHMRVPGRSRTATRPFRDKLAMRETAARGGVRVPEFCSTVNHDALWRFLSSTEGPWLLKPRESASAVGIQKFAEANEVWPMIERLGDEASHSLVERFVPGDIYHVEGVHWGGELLFASPHKYGQPPFETMHAGGIFCTRMLDREGEEAQALLAIQAQTVRALGMDTGVTHSEYIRAHGDGQFYFLECACRVGGAYIAETVEMATGMNPWAEWARIEVAAIRGESYPGPKVQAGYAGAVICLARQEQPDLSGYTDPEIVYRLNKFHHAGLIVRSGEAARVQELCAGYTPRFYADFYARMDAPDRDHL